jgi:hypothetical protein
MKPLYLLLTLLYIPFQIQAQKIDSNPVKEQVKQTFTEFQTSVLNGDKEWPKKFLDAKSIEYFEHILQLINQADSAQLMEEQYSTIFTVLFARYVAPEGKYMTIKNSYDLIYYFNNSLFKANLDSIVIKNIKVKDKTATVYTSHPESTEYVPYDFILEKNVWKLNLIANNEELETVFSTKEVMDYYGDTKEKVVKKLIHDKSWDASDKNIWLPIP